MSQELVISFDQAETSLMAYTIRNTCTKCGACLTECPTGSIYFGKTQYLIDADTCTDHAACVAVCPVDAIYKMKRPDPKTDEGEDSP
jgi:ferredoxin